MSEPTGEYDCPVCKNKGKRCAECVARFQAELAEASMRSCGNPECRLFSNDAWLEAMYCNDYCQKRDHALLREAQRKAMNDVNINEIHTRHKSAIDEGMDRLRAITHNAWNRSLTEAFQLGFKTGKEKDGET